MTSTAQMLGGIESGTALQTTLLLVTRQAPPQSTAQEAETTGYERPAPPGPIFIEELDGILQPYRSSVHASTLQRGDFIEVVGPSGSGKTTFINFLLLTSLLPYSLGLPLPYTSRAHQIPLGGKGQSVALLYSASARSPIPLRARAMRSHIRDAIGEVISTVGPGRLTPEMTAAIEACVEESLGRLRIIRVKARYRYWALALRSLAYPAKEAGGDGVDGTGTGGSLSLVCLDGLSECFWPERYADEERSTSASSTSSRKRSSGIGVPGVRGLDDIGMRDVMDAVGVLRKELGCVVVSTTQGLWHEKKPDSSQSTLLYAPYLPQPYPSPWALRPGDEGTDQHSSATQASPARNSMHADAAHWPLTFQLTLLGRSRGLQFPADTMLSEALGARDRAKQGGERYGARVRMRGVDGPLAGRAGVAWGFGIGSEGLEVFVEPHA